MLIPVLTEPDFQSYLWARQSLDGISQEAARRKYRLEMLDAGTYESMDYDSLFGKERRMLIVIGTSVTWMPKALAFFNAKRIESIFISYDPAETFLPAGMVRMDYVGAIHHLLTYLTEDCGRKRIAMYGYNPDSSADNIKMRFFRRWNERKGRTTDDSVFVNPADLEACYNAFRPHAGRFDAVICANDIVAVSLLSRLIKDGFRVPEDLFVTAFGDSRIAERTDPPLTIATLDFPEVGRQAVLLFSYLYKTPATSSLSSRVRSRLIVRSSTAGIPDTTADSMPREDADAFEAGFNFYSDPEAERLLKAETLLNACDAADLKLMDSLMKGASLDSLEQELFLTASALQYRKRRLMNIAGCPHTADFLAFIAFCRDRLIL